jgi:hypothetical protein
VRARLYVVPTWLVRCNWFAVMAIYHLSVKVISRSAGRSAVAAAAYRCAGRLHDERIDRDHDFTNKGGVVHSEVLLPEGAPEHLSDREQLWNAVEAAEKRKDAQLSREVEFAIPRELDQAEGIRLAREFVEREFVERGMIADLNVHWDIGADGLAKPHAHGRGEERFTSRQMIDIEQRLERASELMAERQQHAVNEHGRDAALARAAERGLVLSGEQRAAFEHVNGERGLSIVVGYAGTGKSAMLGIAREAWEDAGYIFATQDAGERWSPAQTRELNAARDAFEEVRPHGWRDAEAAYKKNPELAREAGSGQVRRAVQALQLETELRTDPQRRADRFVARWQELGQTSQRQYRVGDMSGYKATRSAMGDMAKSLERDPQLESILANRKRELGITISSGSSLSGDLTLAYGLGRGRSRGIEI